MKPMVWSPQMPSITISPSGFGWVGLDDAGDLNTGVATRNPRGTAGGAGVLGPPHQWFFLWRKTGGTARAARPTGRLERFGRPRARRYISCFYNQLGHVAFPFSVAR